MKTAIKWFFGIFFILTGFMESSTSLISSFISFIIGLFLIPPILKLFEGQINYKFSTRQKWLIVITGIILTTFFSIINEGPTARSTKNTNRQNQSELEKIKEEQDQFAREVNNAETNSKEEKTKNKKWIEKNLFSLWDGSHIGLVKYVKKNMNDPKSYEHVETKYKDNGTHIYINMTFRGNNAFGGKVINRIEATSDYEGNIIKVLSNN